MLTMLGSPRRCLRRPDPPRNAARPGRCRSRRLRPAAPARRRRKRRGGRAGRAKSVILLYLLGGAATQDMFDLKPTRPPRSAASSSRSPPTSPASRSASTCRARPQWMHKTALVRSVNHKAGCHNSLPSYTGYEQLLPDITTTRDTYPPSMGSVCEYLQHAASGDLPDYVYMPCYLGWGQAIRRAGPYAGFLGQRYDPLFTECTPYRRPGRATPAPGQPRTVLRRAAPARQHAWPTASPSTASTTAAACCSSSTTSCAGSTRSAPLDQLRPHPAAGLRPADLGRRSRPPSTSSSEDPRLRDRYGRTLFGNSTLIARRLVEAGVRFVNVTWDLFWDRVPDRLRRLGHAHAQLRRSCKDEQPAATSTRPTRPCWKTCERAACSTRRWWW